MADYTMTLRMGASTGGLNISKNISVEASGRIGVNQLLGNLVTETLDVHVPVNQIVGFFMVCDQDIQVKATYAATDSTHDLNSDVPIMFSTEVGKEIGDNFFDAGETIEEIELSNGGSEDANFQLELVYQTQGGAS